MTNLTSPIDSPWIEGPPMSKRRINHKCGRIRKSKNSEEFSIIVVGGTADKTSVEIYDMKKQSWKSGPEIPSKKLTPILNKTLLALKFRFTVNQ